jgi:hypothetical protein
VVSKIEEDSSRETLAAPCVGRHLLLPMLCIAAGGVIGFIGQRMTGSSAWFLAVPAYVGPAWLFVADPSACHSQSERPSRRSST